MNNGCRIESLFFWLGGVLFPPLWEILERGAFEIGKTSSPDSRAGWINLSRLLSAGLLSPTNLKVEIGKKMEHLDFPSKFQPDLKLNLAVDHQVRVLAQELSEKLNLYLISDYPAAWLQEFWQSSFLELIFPWETVAFTDKMNISEPDVSVIKKLAKTGTFQPGKSLLVDADPVRSMQVVRAGFDATIFVDARRLRRDLWLWSIVQQPK